MKKKIGEKQIRQKKSGSTRNVGKVTNGGGKKQVARANDKPADIEFIARGVLTEDSRVLLCRDAKRGYYALPGGHIEFGESAAVALVREFEEECGLLVRPRQLLQVHEHGFHNRKRAHHEINLVFRVEPQRGVSLDKVQSREPKIVMEWVDLASLADLDLRPPAAKALLMAGGFEGQPEWVSDVPSRD